MSFLFSPYTLYRIQPTKKQMFIEQAFKSLHEAWRYLIGSLIIIVFWMFIGQGPLTFVLLGKSLASGGAKTASSVADLIDLAGISSNLFIFLLLLSFAIGLLGIWIVSRFLHKQNFRDLTTTRKKVDWKRIRLSFSIMAIVVLVTGLLDYFWNREDYIIQFDLSSFAVLFVISMLFIPLQTSFEEYFFRGYLMQGLGVITRNRWFPLVLTSLIFGGLHYFNPEVMQLGPWIMLYYIGTGLFLGILTLMDEGMELSLGFHAANNLITILLVTADWTAFQSDSILKDISKPDGAVGELIFSLVFLYPLLLIYFSKKYHWTHWKEKLTGKVIVPAEEAEDDSFF